MGWPVEIGGDHGKNIDEQGQQPTPTEAMPGMESSNAETTTRMRGITVITRSTRNTRKARKAARPLSPLKRDIVTTRKSKMFQPFLI